MHEISQNLDDSISHLREISLQKGLAKYGNSKSNQKKLNELEQGGFLNSTAP